MSSKRESKDRSELERDLEAVQKMLYAPWRVGTNTVLEKEEKRLKRLLGKK